MTSLCVSIACKFTLESAFSLRTRTGSYLPRVLGCPRDHMDDRCSLNVQVRGASWKLCNTRYL